MLDDKTISIVARQLSKHYSNSRNENSPVGCACTGLSGECTSCSLWWEMFLREYSFAQVSTMHSLYGMMKSRLEHEAAEDYHRRKAK